MLAPLSMKEVVAERDLLRAEHALEQHRLERRVATLQDASARHRADLGRRTTSLVAFEGEIAGLRDELAARERDIFSLEGDLGASRIALNDFSARIDGALSEISSLKDRRLTLETAADDQRTTIAGLETRASGLEMKLGDALQTAKGRAAATQAETARLSSELAARTSEVARLNAALGEALAKGATLVADLEKKNAELTQTRQRLSEVETAAREQAREAAATESGRERVNGAGHDPVPADAVKDAKRDADSGAQGDLALREAIARLAADVVRLSGAPAEEAPPRAKPSKTGRRVTRAPSSQGPDTGEGAASSAKPRQLQSTAPGR
ncbi:hypothetical protein [Methylocapsa sp. S129]|uniref:hypothetical protein n=1 Tax=Methylocapsa sp. S129 TaxID=1641869 RepID=UPI00131B32D1|nr:hypothetical protein [Methylocapsa sp. S129]